VAARGVRMGRMSRRLQARAKRNATVHAASSAPCSRHRELIVPPHCLWSARSSPVVRPNARLRRARLRAPPKRALGRRRFVAAARLPPSRSRAATGRCTVRRHHRSHRNERHAPPPQSVRRPHAGRSAPRPGTASIGAFIVGGETAVADAAPRIYSASAIVHRVGAAQLSAARACKNRRRSPRRAVQPNLTPLG
jgi:hypothetical protein